MTQEERNEVFRHIEVEKAYLEGKEIEYNHGVCGWTPCLRPLWNWADCDYRVKPKPQYRPFESVEEVMEAIKEHGHFLRRKTTDTYKIIREYDFGYIWIGLNVVGDSFESAFDNYTFADGTPFGKLMTE